LANKIKYKRALLKISGEALSGRDGFGIDMEKTKWLAAEISGLSKSGAEIAIMIGGGNIIRGKNLVKEGMDQVLADYAGMMGTIINSLVLADTIEKLGIQTRVQSAIAVESVIEPFIQRKAIKHLEKGRIVIFASGTGNPYFTTDTAASLRALEVNANVIIKGTKVDGVYSDDPEIVSSAKKFGKLSYIEVLQKGLKIMDSTAISLCMDNKISVIVIDLFKRGNLLKAISGEKIGSIIE
jgi:uridylate kinase